MATPKPPYDPVKSIEGMYNGTLTRIAYSFKDTVNFGRARRLRDPNTGREMVLRAPAACAQTEAGAKAREEQAATAKRKRSEEEDAAEKEQEAKRVKIGEAAKETEEVPAPAAEIENAVATPPKPKPTSPVAITDQSPQQKKPSPLKPPEPAPEKPPETNDEFSVSAKPTPAGPETAATMEGANDFDQFESMFGEPTGDDGGMNGDGDLGFDLGLNDDVFGDSSATNDQNATDSSDLNTLLPGLESYANQDSTAGGTGDGTQNPQTNPTTQTLDFGLPDLGGPNEFDMIFDAENFDNMPMDGNMGMNDEDVNLDLNMDLESMFTNN
ncbi:uncharacterized protein AB675_10981 [Cyphellophora attinorum]|uniref:Uncharacterized protein n=1 Tax=Cyphellophora attinorum TaxID=1664694 RepID=A0A0N1NWG7_9EURO|nr:uncharacterized protein AB675_10981 [Phialophora attinorum]KPI35544.1 hypothetical protein AB675_10981 [Phialophora attinorum]